MKKFLLTMAIVALGVFSMNANEVTINTTNATKWEQVGNDYKATVDGFTITLAKAGYTSTLKAPDENAARVYVKATLSVTAPAGAKMTKVAMTEVHSGAEKLDNVTFSEGWTAYGQLSSSTVAEEFGAESAGLNELVMTAVKQVRISKIVVTYTPGAGGLESSGLGYDVNSMTVNLGEEFTAPTLTNPNNLAVTYNSSEETVATVDAQTGAVEIVGLGTTTITATSAETDKYYEGKASYTLTVRVPLQEVASVAKTIELENKTDFIVNYDLTVGFVNSNNIFVVDEAGDFIQIYGSNSYKIGDVISAGWEGTYTLYNNVTPEIVPIGSLPEAKEGTFTPEVVTYDAITTDFVNKVVKINNVVLSEASPANKSNFSGTVGETEVALRNNYALPSVAAGIYNITVVVAIYNSNVQLYVANYEEVETAEPMLSATKELSFATPLNGTQESTVVVTAKNITDNLTLTVDNSAFTLASSTVSVEDAANGIVVTYTGATAGNVNAKLTISAAGLSTEVALSALTVPNAGTEDNPLTVGDVLAMNSLNKITAYVQGTIHDKTAASTNDGVIKEASTAANSNLILKDADGNMIPVALPNGEARTALNIVDNPGNIGQTVIVKGSLEKYFGAAGVKNTKYVSGLLTSIDDIEAADNAPVEYFNLQGVRVANPENGLFIRRQGNKISKVIVK